MAITINNGIANIYGTPGAISGIFINRPAALNVAEGTLYFATDTAVIYQVVAGSWVNYAGGGGGGTSNGINGINGTTNIGLGGTLINDTIVDGDNNSYSLTFDLVKSLIVNTNSFSINSSDPNSFFIFTDAISQLKIFGAGMFLNNKITIIGDWDYNNAGTKLIIDDDAQQIKTLFGNNQFGLYIDNGITVIGDYDNAYNNTKIIVEQFNAIIKTALYQSGSVDYSNYGIFIDANNGNPYTVIGDYGNNNSGTRMYITENKIITTALGVIQKGLICNYVNDTYQLGDFNADTNGITLVVDNNVMEIYTGKNSGGTNPDRFGFYMRQDNISFRKAGIGDVLGQFLNTSISVDDLNSQILINGQVTSSSSGGNSGIHLIIFINGVEYKIRLENP